MTAADALKRALRDVLPTGFIRRARDEEWLFVSDYPRFTENDAADKLSARGWTCARRGDTLLIDLAPARYASLAAALPPPRKVSLSDDNLPLYSLAALLSRASVPPEKQPIPALRLALKYAGTREEGALCAALYAMIAQALREGTPLPTAAASILTNDFAEGIVC